VREEGRVLSTCCADPPAQSAYYTNGLYCGSPAGRPSLQLHHRVYTPAGLNITDRGEAGPRSGQPLGWRRAIRDRIAELESRRLTLEEERVRTHEEGTNEGDRLEAELGVELQQIGEQINDLRASLE
jgi:hypothetical protein